jgi:hypothetical protein
MKHHYLSAFAALILLLTNLPSTHAQPAVAFAPTLLLETVGVPDADLPDRAVAGTGVTGRINPGVSRRLRCDGDRGIRVAEEGRLTSQWSALDAQGRPRTLDPGAGPSLVAVRGLPGHDDRSVGKVRIPSGGRHPTSNGEKRVWAADGTATPVMTKGIARPPWS